MSRKENASRPPPDHGDAAVVPDWPIYLINMDKDTERLAAAEAEFASHGLAWTRVPAVNGRALDPAELARAYDAVANRRRARHPLTGPEIGCYLSHIAAWHRIAASGAPGGIVLEDDFRVIGDLGGTLRALAADRGDWDLAKLFSFRPGVKLLECRDIGPDLRIGTPYRVPSTTLGYAVRAPAAARLIAASLPFFRPIDEDHKFFWEKSLRVVQVDPQPIAMGEQATADGSVGQSRKDAVSDDARGPAARAWAGLRYQIGYAAGLHLRRLFGR